LTVENHGVIGALVRKPEHVSVRHKAKWLTTDTARFWCLLLVGFCTDFNIQKILNGD